MSDYEVIPYRPELKEQVVALRRHAYADDFPEAGAYLEWKYERNPYITRPIFYLALYAGRVVGMRGMYGTSWHVPGSDAPVVLPCADDFAIVPSHRDTGVASKIMRVALEDLARRGFPYVLNSSGGRVTVLSSLAMGWKSIGAMEPVARYSPVRRAWYALGRRTRGKRLVWRFGRPRDHLHTTDPKPFERLDRIGSRDARAPASRITIESEPRTEAMVELAERLRGPARIHHVRDTAFFAWRYHSPIREYRFLYYERRGQLEGYLAIARYRAYRPPMHPFPISDVEASSPEIRTELIESAVSWGRFPELATWTGTASDETRDALARSGFIPTDLALRARGMPCVLLHRLTPPSTAEWTLGDARALDLANWDFRLIDSMHG